MLDNSFEINNIPNLWNRAIPKCKNSNLIKEEKEICNLLKPIKNAINQSNGEKGAISLIAIILEFFYDKKRKILSKNDLSEGIKNTKNKYYLTIYKKDLFNNLDPKNDFEILFKAIKNLKYFEELYINEEEYLLLNIRNIKKNISKILYEIKKQNDLLVYKPTILLEIEEEKLNNNKHIYDNNKNEINSNNIYNNKILINTNINRKIIEFKTINKKINHYIENIDNKHIDSNSIQNKKRKIAIKNNKNIIKAFLKKKRQLSKRNKEIKSNSSSLNNFPILSIESLPSFSYIPRKTERVKIENIFDSIIKKNQGLISKYFGKSIKEIEEEKIEELKNEIAKKNLEIKYREYILRCWEFINCNCMKEKENNSIILLENIEKDIENIYKRLNEEIEYLYASHFLLTKRCKMTNDINTIEIQKCFVYNFNICVGLYKKFRVYKMKYLSCLECLIVFIRMVNNVDINIKENSNDDDNPSYKGEIETIEELKNYLKLFENIIKKNILKYLKETPFEKKKLSDKNNIKEQ